VSPASVDLFSASFWLAAAVAVLLLTPLTRVFPRQLGFALVNVGFLLALIKLRTLGAIVGVVLLHALLRACADPKRGSLVLRVVIAGGVAVFCFHKLPLPAASAKPVALLESMLGAIGFSYVLLRMVDVARTVYAGRQPPPGLVGLFNYLMPFHMLAAGPIQAYDDFVAGLAAPAPAPSAVNVLSGVERVAFGMFKKFVVAYSIERLFLTAFMADGWYFVLEMHLYLLWFYIDFSAYSDVAVGLGQLMGVRTPENFNRPYLARNMIEFWERWHITLGDWIRRHLYVPIQLAWVRRTGGRYQLGISLVSVAAAFTISGAWHGLTLPFLIWGVMHGVGVMIATLYRHVLTRRLGKKGVKAYLERPWIRVVATFVTLEWVAASLVVVGWHWEFRR
jgi:D-alanyl-lipoteichoic acid acyltransferase DltB (MBOAT superfamily)